MQTGAGRTTYNRRMHIGETPFAIIKRIMEVRRFLLRGLDKVRTEWCWVCTAYNLKKLIAAVAALRTADGAEPAIKAARIDKRGGLRAAVFAATTRLLGYDLATMEDS